MSAFSLTNIATRVILLEGWRAYLLAFAVGAVSALGLAPFHLFPVLLVTVPIFVWLLDGAIPAASARPGLQPFQRIWPAFRTGWLFGFGYLLAGLWWIGAAFLVDAEEFIWLLPLAVTALPAGLALFYGLAAVLARLAWVDGWPRLIALAAAMTFGEWLRGTVLTGLPWNTLGMVFMPSPLLMQSAALFGLYGMTFLTLLIASAPAIFAPGGDTQHSTGIRRKRRVRAVLLCALALFAGHLAYGFITLSNASDATQPDVRLRIVQPAIDQSVKWEPENEKAIGDSYLDLSNLDRGPQSAGVSSFTHLIWPESAFPFVLTQNRNYLAAIGNMLPARTTLITGAMRVEEAVGEDTEPRVYNTLYMIDGSGEITAAYDKTRLVPFGEFLPFQETLESIGLQQLTRLRGGFEKGSRRQVMAAETTPPFLPLICYEIIFSGQVRGAADGDEPQWIVNVTNDGWFGNTPGPYQHAHQAQIRAVEEGLPLVRAANSGISMITDARGRIVGRLGLGQRGVVDGPLPVAVSTVYAQTRNLPLLIVLFVLYGFLILIRSRAGTT